MNATAVAGGVLASTATALSYALFPAVAASRGVYLVGKGGLWVVSLFKPSWAAALLLGSYMSTYAAERRARLKFKSDALAKLADANAETLKLLIGELPSWVNYPDFDRVTWLNTLIAQMWPSIDEVRIHAQKLCPAWRLCVPKLSVLCSALPRYANCWLAMAYGRFCPFVNLPQFVNDIVRAQVGPILQGIEGKLRSVGVMKVEIKHFSLGKPPKITGIKAWCGLEPQWRS